MRIDILGLQAFIGIAERGSFHAAASHLNLSQTALSHRIRKLEESLATPLFTRTTRQVTLTAAGSALLPKARKIFDDLGAAIGELRSAASDSHDRITLGCLPTVAVHVLPEVIAAFSRDWPEVVVKVLDSSATEIAERVQAGDAEFGVTIVAANRWNLDLKPVAREPFVLVCRRDMDVARSRHLTWAQLQGLPLVRISAETGNRILVDDALGARRETLSWRYEAQRVTTAVALARSGVAAVIVPQLAYDVAEDGTLVAIPLRGPTVTRTLGIITRKDVTLSQPAQAFLTLMVAALKARFARSEIMSDK
jgi:DNA-binding transcriptional LysR family regulator